MHTKNCDVAIIGSGPGGEGAAMKASKEGKKVIVVEKFSQVGGTCTHSATIPTKTLRYAGRLLLEARSDPRLRSVTSGPPIGFPDLQQSATTVIARQVGMRAGFYDRNRIEVAHGTAHFVDSHTIEVDPPDQSRFQIAAENFVIATGSRPYHPPDVDFTHPRIRDAETILKLDRTPQSLTIYGAGVVGCEYASIFRNLGVKVNLINTFERLLAFLDAEIVDALAYHLREEGVLIRQSEEFDRIEGGNDNVVLHLQSGKRIKADILLWANGRTGNSAGLGLEELGITTDSRGNIEVNKTLQTAQSHIYAVGDVAGPPALASAAYDEGRYAARHIISSDAERILLKDIPTGIYTSPEISSLGRTEAELTAAKVPYEVGQCLFRNLTRAQITGRTTGMLKILFHRETLQLLGIHCFGYQAAEIIHIGQAIMTQKGEGNTLMYFINTTFNYPTMAEAYRIAALNGLNRID
jgi:NAD(P) transhydrogenase